MSVASIRRCSTKRWSAPRACCSTSAAAAGPVIDVTDENELPKRATITLRREKLDRLIGHVVPSEQVSDILRRTGCG